MCAKFGSVQYSTVLYLIYFFRYLKHVLLHTESYIEKIELYSDGSWKAVSEDENFSQATEKTNAPITNRQTTLDSQVHHLNLNKNDEPEIVLLTDSEEEGETGTLPNTVNNLLEIALNNAGIATNNIEMFNNDLAQNTATNNGAVSRSLANSLNRSASNDSIVCIDDTENIDVTSFSTSGM